MNFKIDKYISFSDMIDKINDSTFLPRSESLLLSLSLNNSNKGFVRKSIYESTKNHAEFLPITVFSNEMKEHHSEIFIKIMNYKSSIDSELAEIFNKIVMLVYCSVQYADKKKWDTYFSGYYNKDITEPEKHSLLESIANDISSMLGLKPLKFVQYTYGLDNIYRKYYETIAFNPALNKVYIEEVLGRDWTHQEEEVRKIIYYAVGNNILNSLKTNSKLKNLFGISDSRLSSYNTDKQAYNNDLNQIADALEYCYNIYAGKYTV